jgi:hypothetical protein
MSGVSRPSVKWADGAKQVKCLGIFILIHPKPGKVPTNSLELTRRFEVDIDWVEFVRAVATCSFAICDEEVRALAHGVDPALGLAGSAPAPCTDAFTRPRAPGAGSV